MDLNLDLERTGGAMLKSVQGFKDFIMRGNVVDLAVGIVIGAAFSGVVTAITKSFIEPLIRVFSGGKELSGKFTVNATVFDWAAATNAVITFLITAAVLYFLVVTPMNRLAERRRKGIEPESKAPAEDVLLLREIRDALVGRTETHPDDEVADDEPTAEDSTAPTRPKPGQAPTPAPVGTEGPAPGALAHRDGVAGRPRPRNRPFGQVVNLHCVLSGRQRQRHVRLAPGGCPGVEQTASSYTTFPAWSRTRTRTAASNTGSRHVHVELGWDGVALLRRDQPHRGQRVQRRAAHLVRAGHPVPYDPDRRHPGPVVGPRRR
jgi:large conductance mechanosensitive channel